MSAQNIVADGSLVGLRLFPVDPFSPALAKSVAATIAYASFAGMEVALAKFGFLRATEGVVLVGSAHGARFLFQLVAYDRCLRGW